MDSIDFGHDRNNSLDDLLKEAIEVMGEKFVDNDSSTPFMIISGVIYGLLAVLGLIANSLFCIVVYRCEKLHNVTHVLMTNLAAANVFFLLFFPPYFMTTFIFEANWDFGTILCKISYSVGYITCTASFYLMGLVAVDRWLAIFLRKRRLDRKKCIFLTVVIWLISLCVAAPYFFLAEASATVHNNTLLFADADISYFKMGERVVCGCRWYDYNYRTLLVALSVVVQYAIPLVVMVPAYTHLAYFLWSRPMVGVQSREKTRKQMRRRKRLLATLIAIVVFLMVCWMPLFFLRAFDVFFGSASGQEDIRVYVFASLVTLLGVFATPICYLMNDVFRQQTFHLIACFVPGWKYAHRSETSMYQAGTRLTGTAHAPNDLDIIDPESKVSTSHHSSRRGTPVDIVNLPHSRSVLIRVCQNPGVRQRSELEFTSEQTELEELQPIPEIEDRDRGNRTM